MAEKSGLTAANSAKALQAFMDTVSQTLKGDDSISLVGFGTFTAKSKPERKGRNPRTGLIIPARRVAHFKPGKGLNESI